MKILVPVKRVPNPEQKLKFAGGGLDLSGASWQVNPFDEYAVETALRLTEKGKGGEHVGEVVVVSIGPKDVAQQMRGLLAMGADRGLLVTSEDAALDSDLVARTLAALVKSEAPDVVVMGKQATDDDSNEVGKVHLGVVHIFRLESDAARKREAVITESGFLTIPELRARRDALETWSQLCLDGLDRLLATAR